MAFLLQVHFNEKGVTTNPDVKSLGGIDYSDPSPLRDGFRSAYFPPMDDKGGLKISGSTLPKIYNALSSERAEYTVYLKYKIKEEYLIYEETPIIAYESSLIGTGVNFICIKDKRICVYDTEYTYHLSDTVDYTFDGEWHTLVVSKNSEYLRIFVDGFIRGVYYSNSIIPIGKTAAIYIGFNNALGTMDHCTNFGGGWMDDICIVDHAVYSENFVPPNMYWQGEDRKSNYYLDKIHNLDGMPYMIKEETEKNLAATAFHINEKQKGWLPKRLRLNWHEEDFYFKHEEYFRVCDHRTYTAVSITGLEQPLLMEPNNDRFVDIFNAEEALNDNKIYAFMLFIDKIFIPLSKIYIIKSDNFYTLFIVDREPDPYNMIKSLEMVQIPFPVIYEEGLGQRKDIDSKHGPLYIFNKSGLFTVSNGYAYYYIDPNRAKDMYTTGIREQNIPIEPQQWSEEDSNNNGDGTNSDKGGDNGDGTDDEANYLHSYWRYGTFSISSQDSNYYYVKFNSSDKQFPAREGYGINLFKNTLLIDSRQYFIVGENLFKFKKRADLDLDLFNGRNITMQIITDKRDFSDIANDLIEMKDITVKAVKDKQSKFAIPDAKDSDGKRYDQFLVFKENYCMNGEQRIRISNSKTYIYLTEPTDFLDKGDTLTFVFLKCLKANQYGPLHVKPYYLYTRAGRGSTKIYEPPANTDTEGRWTSEIVIPSHMGIKYTVNNIITFINGKFISPDRYTIKDNILTLKDPNYFRVKESYGVTFVLLKMLDEITDPSGKRGSIIDYQQKQGSRFVLYDMNDNEDAGDWDAFEKGALTIWNKLTLDNFVVFDQYGKYMPDIIGEVFNMNIIKYIKSSEDPVLRVPRFLTCVYSPKSLRNKANVVIPKNFHFIKDYIRLYQEFAEMDKNFYEFISDYDVRYSRSKYYGQNLAKAFFYTLQYNELNFLNMYKRLAPGKRGILDIYRINEKFKANGIMNKFMMHRDEFHSSKYRTYSIFFLDGLVPYWQKYIEYFMNIMYLRLDKKVSGTKLECIKLKGMNNMLEPLDSNITPNV